MSYSPWGHKEWDMTEQLMLSLTLFGSITLLLTDVETKVYSVSR